MKKPKISAIVSTYNSENFIEGCLENLLEQTVIDETEIIVIDSGSKQNEKEIVRRYLRRCSRIRYVRTAREKLYSAWNRGIRLARGRYITTANTDDRSSCDAYEKMAHVLDNEKSIALVYSDIYLTKRKNDSFHLKDIPKKRILQHKPDYSLHTLFFKNPCGPRPMYRKAVHEKIGYFNPRYTAMGDWEFWLRMSERYRMKRIPEPLCLFYVNMRGVYFSCKENMRDREAICRKYLGRDYL